MFAPFSLGIRCQPRVKGGFDFFLLDEQTRIDHDLIGQFVTFMPKDFWRDDSSPVVQVALPHFFVCDELCYLNQLPAYSSRDAVKLPGQLISGRFPTNIWPRALNLAFEWTEFDSDFIMKRGDPVCYLLFETARPDRPISLVPAHMTQELQDYRKRIEDVVRFTSGTFSLLREAEKFRPGQLLHEV